MDNSAGGAPLGIVQQYSADEILESEATREMWLRAVQQDPSNFLAVKFSMQLQRREGAP